MQVWTGWVEGGGALVLSQAAARRFSLFLSQAAAGRRRQEADRCRRGRECMTKRMDALGSDRSAAKTGRDAAREHAPDRALRCRDSILYIEQTWRSCRTRLSDQSLPLQLCSLQEGCVFGTRKLFTPAARIHSPASQRRPCKAGKLEIPLLSSPAVNVVLQHPGCAAGLELVLAFDISRGHMENTRKRGCVRQILGEIEFVHGVVDVSARQLTTPLCSTTSTTQNCRRLSTCLPRIICRPQNIFQLPARCMTQSRVPS